MRCSSELYLQLFFKYFAKLCLMPKLISLVSKLQTTIDLTILTHIDIFLILVGLIVRSRRVVIVEPVRVVVHHRRVASRSWKTAPHKWHIYPQPIRILPESGVWVETNPSNAEATLVQSTMTQRSSKTIQTLPCWYSLDSFRWAPYQC